MSFSSEYNKLRKKQLEEETAAKKQTSGSFSDQYNALRVTQPEEDDSIDYSGFAPISKQLQSNVQENALNKINTFKNAFSESAQKQIRPTLVAENPLNAVFGAPTIKLGVTTGAKSQDKETEDKRTWFTAGEFDDGYQFGDVTKTILGTAADTVANVGGGLLEMGENVIDAGAYLVGGVGELFGAKDFAEGTKNFIASDLYSGEEIASRILSAGLVGEGGWDDASVFGEKLDSVAQSGGQLAGQIAAQSVGIPWWVTSAVTSFGKEVESQFNEGATYGEAGLSGIVSAGAEILTEKLFGGSGLGEKGLINLDGLTKGLSNKVVKAVADLGVDMAAEGTEEVVSSVINRIGTALIKKKNLAELLTSEEAVDEYIESFIGGAALGGIMNAAKVDSARAKKGGRDYRTGLTENEQKVFDEVYKEAIAEEKKNTGKELSKKEEAKIYDEVMESLQKGQISTDTIERLLGGESYTAYEDAIKNDNAAIEEMKKLYEGEELEQKIKDILDNSKRGELKEQLSKEVFGIAESEGALINKSLTGKRNSFLSESYYELAKRSQAFEADLSQYDEKYRSTVQKAIDSGILNNTRRTHEMVELFAKLSADKGVEIDFTNNEKIKETSFVVEGKTVNGYVTENGDIAINIDSPRYLNSIVGHEITHILEGAKLYDAFQEEIFKYAESKGEYKDRLRNALALYKDVEGYKGADGFKKIKREVVADLVGDYLFTDTEFVRNLHNNNRNVFQKIWDEIKYLCKVATAGSKEAKQLEQVKHLFEKIYQEGGKAKGEVKHSLSEVDPVQPTSDKWRRTLTTEEAKARFPKLWDVTADESEVRNPTQISSTVRSYRKVYDQLKAEGFNGTILDASSGLGYGTKAGIEEYGFDVEDIEPYPDKNYNPKYKDYSALDKKYDVVISNAVMNVLPQDQRDALVVKMGEMLNDGGRIFINVRGKDVDTLASNENNTNISPMEWFVDSTGSYQKGFTKPELVAYLQDALGDGFTVKPTSLFGAVSAIVTKDSGVKYSLSEKTIDKFNEKQYNAFGWARDTEAISKNELDDMYSKIQEKGSLKKFAQSSHGEAIIEVNDKPHTTLGTNNVFAFVTGTKNNPQITRVVRFQAETDTEMEIIKEKLYERGSFSNTYYSFLIEEGFAREYSKKSALNYIEYNEKVRRRSIGEESSGADKNSGLLQNGSRTSSETQSNEIGPVKASSEDGVFFDGQKRKFSLSADSEGNSLSAGQSEYFKDSKVLDRNGNLLKVYHTTNNDFTVFDKARKGEATGDGNTYMGFFFSDDAEYMQNFPEFQNGKTEAYYLNIKNPIDMTDISEEAFLDVVEVLGGDVYAAADLYEEVKSENGGEPMHLVHLLQEMVGDTNYTELVEELKPHYDELMAKGYDGVVNYLSEYYGTKEYIVLDSNQAKLTTNLKPTSNPDIRYSLSTDSEGRTLSEGQKKYFNGSKVVDENGSLKVVYHGSPADFNTFSLDYLGANGTAEGYGFYFTDKKSIAEGYSKGREGQQGGVPGKLFEVYLDIKKPLSDKEVTMSRAQFKKFLTELNKQVDEDGEPLDVLSNYGDVEWEGLNKVLNYAMEIEYDGSDNDVNLVHSIINGCGNMETVFNVLRKVTGYDGIIVEEASWGGDQTIYVAFHPEQVKNVDNLDPSTDPDTRYSLSAIGEHPIKRGNLNIRGEDVRLDAPIREDIRKAETTSDIAPLPQYNIPPSEPVSEAEASAYQRERLDSLDDMDAPVMEDAEPYELRSTSQLPKTKVAEISRRVRATLGLSNNQMRFVRGLIEEYSQNEALDRDDLFEVIKANFSNQTLSFDSGVKEVQTFLRESKIAVTDDIKNDITDYDSLRRSLSRKIHFSEDGVAVDTKYQELTELFPEYFPDDIVNPADQLSRIAEVATMERTLEEDIVLDDAELMQAADMIVNEVNSYNQQWTQKLAERNAKHIPTDDFAPIRDDIAPKAQTPKQQTINSAPTAEATAQILTEEPQAEKKKSRGWSKLVSNFFDKGSVFETLSLKKGNRELQAKYNNLHYSEGRAQRLIGKGSKANGVTALNDIQKDVEKAGLTKQLYEYMYHQHNIDRMTLDQRFGIPNKTVFGDAVTADVSREAVATLERQHPNLKWYAEELYAFNKHLRKMLVDGGVISQETADLWEKMYPHYVPIRRLGDTGLNVNVPLDTARTGVNAPIKRATGGSRDILPLFDTMAQRAIQTYKAVAKNSFGVELKNTLGTSAVSNIEGVANSIDEMMENVDKHEDLLQKGENGRSPTFTVFENGQRVTFDITEDMYDALKPTSEGLAYTNKALNKAGNIHRGLLTEYNPTFMLTNAIKDAQDVLMNSQHAAKTYKNFPKAIKELWNGARGKKEAKWYTEYMENGGEQNTYFDNQQGDFVKEKSRFSKVIGMPLEAISAVNNFIERVPRLAEYIASRESGRSIDVSMLDAARVTTNFAAGGDVTKLANRNGATFLNASVQGFMQQVRNVREAKHNGLKGWALLATKAAGVGLAVEVLNQMFWDDDEEYEELSDYVKQNYYVVAKLGDGQFVRIPKGRTLAVIQNAFEQISNAATGDDEVDLGAFLELAVSNLAPNNPIDNNIIAPIMQVASNKTWYGEDLVPSRLQDLPAAEQYDESTDAISKWLGENLNVSPYQINYLLNQYSGGLGDVILPMLTPEAERGDTSIIAPLADKFTTDSVLNNQNVSDFYDKMDELTTNAKSSKATDEDVLKYKFFNAVNSELGDLYQQKREIQNSGLSDSAKFAQIREIQEQINSIARDSLREYESVSVDGVYATVGDIGYRLHTSETGEQEWQKITDKQLKKQEEVTSGLGISASEYWSNKSEYDFAYEYPEKYSFLNENGYSYSDYDDADEDGKRALTWASENPTKYEVSKVVVDDIFEYRRITGELYNIKADKDANGKSISGSRKEKVIEYINNLDLDYGEKIILFKSEYKSDDSYNWDIVDYLNSRNDLSYSQVETILKELGFTVDAQGNIYW